MVLYTAYCNVLRGIKTKEKNGRGTIVEWDLRDITNKCNAHTLFGSWFNVKKDYFEMIKQKKWVCTG